MPDYYSKTIVGAVIDQVVFGDLLREYLPDMYTHLEQLGLIISDWRTRRPCCGVCQCCS